MTESRKVIKEVASELGRKSSVLLGTEKSGQDTHYIAVFPGGWSAQPHQKIKESIISFQCVSCLPNTKGLQRVCVKI